MRAINSRSLFFALGLVMASAALAQTYPARSIRMLVPFAPSGSVDFVARLVGARLADELGQPIVIDNRGGAGGTIATGMLAKAPGDGYTLMTMHQGLAFNASLYASLPFDTLRDIAPVANIGATPNVLVVTDALTMRSVQDFLAYARANPGKIAYGSGGIGSAGHLSIELLQSLTGVKLTHIPYKGSGPALTDLVAGEIQAMLLTMPAAMPFVKSGKLRALATSGSQRSPALPQLPTIAESGVPGYEYMPWYGVFAPASLPEPIAARLHQAVNKVLADPALAEKLAQQGLETHALSRREFATVVRDDVERWAKIIRAAGVRGE